MGGEGDDRGWDGWMASLTRWHHWLDGHEFEQALGVGDGQESLVCCSPWGHKESDMNEQLNWTPSLCHLWSTPQGIPLPELCWVLTVTAHFRKLKVNIFLKKEKKNSEQGIVFLLGWSGSELVRRRLPSCGQKEELSPRVLFLQPAAAAPTKEAYLSREEVYPSRAPCTSWASPTRTTKCSKIKVERTLKNYLLKAFGRRGKKR